MAHMQYKFQGAVLSMKEVIKIFKEVNLSGVHCT